MKADTRATAMTPRRRRTPLRALAAASLLALLAAGSLAACSGSPGSGPKNTVDPGPLQPNGPISWSEAGSRIGEVLSVEGPVTSAGRDASGGVVLNVGGDASDPSRFVVMIPKAALGRFPADPESRYEGQLVVATGEIVDQGGTAAMVIRSPKHLTVGQ
jgi:hypothetical protein